MVLGIDWDKMFKKARNRLTISYLIIISIISISLSSIIFKVINQITLENLQREERRIQKSIPPEFRELNQGLPQISFSENAFETIKYQNFVALSFFNLVVISISGIIGYWLAGKSLEPIEENDRKQKEFIGNAAHELKTPLTSIKTSLEVSLKDTNLDLSEAKNVINSALEDVDTMNNLVKNLLKLERSQELKLNISEVNLTELVNKSILKFKNQILTKKIVVNKNIKTSLFYCDEQLLSELFAILIDNSIKFSDTYGELTINIKNDEDFLNIEFTDNGLGIPKEKIPFIFDRFYTGDTSRNKDINEGFGLGLAIAKEIVGKHRGEISVESEENKFTTFKINLSIKNS